MPSFADLKAAAHRTKALLIGETGSGKTGSLAALANAGYNLRIIDYDNGLDLLGSLLTPEAEKRVVYETFTDTLLPLKTGITWSGTPMSYPNSLALLDRWKMPERTLYGRKVPAYDLGSVTDWGPDDVLVIDSLTIQGNTIMRYGQSQQQFLDEARKMHPHQADWGLGQNYQERFLEFLYSDRVKCNVIVTSHIRRVGGGGVQTTKLDSKGKTTGEVTRELDSIEGKGYPSALGRQLPPKVGRYFNTMLYYFTNALGIRQISTVPRDNIDCKTPCPMQLDPLYRIEDGLLKIFQTIRRVHSLEATPTPTGEPKL